MTTQKPGLAHAAPPAPGHRVVWLEGMYLRPQHFQQLERYVEQYVTRRTVGLQGAYWGWMRLDIDHDAYALGRVTLLGGSGVMPDGTPFAFGAEDAPQSYDVPTDLTDELVVLALPIRRAGGPEIIFTEDEGSAARFHVVEREVMDRNAIALGPAIMQLAAPRLRLTRASALTADWQAIGAVRVIERRTDHKLVIDANYIPPVLEVAAQPALRGMVAELHGLLTQRSEALAARLTQPGRGGVSEVSDFLLLELVNRYLALTWHAQQAVQVHPERLFIDWLKLACDLSTHTSPTRRPVVWPVYDHDNLNESIRPLLEELRRSLSAVLEQSAISIELEERSHGVRVGRMPDPVLVRDASFVLAVHADMPADAVQQRFPTQVKVGSVERIRDLVQLQLPGVAVRALPVAPRQIPYHAGYHYFELDKGGDMWRQLEKSGGFAMHLAGEFPGLNMEFWAIRP
ncbi:MAG: type VI secretion system baseplate subunit TssK [Burkholderiaceae bacterium]|nr:type VI secretion system baseplate subunit TssK [Burkholderiaceae bacterium]